MSKNKSTQQSLADAAAAMTVKPDSISAEDYAAIKMQEAEEAKREAEERAAAIDAAASAAVTAATGMSVGDLTDALRQTIVQNGKPEAAAKTEPAKSAPPPFAIKAGRIRKPRRTIIYGPGGVGKTTLVADIEDVIFVDANNGTESLDVPRYIFRPEDQLRGHVPRTWEELRAGCKILRTTKHPYKTVVFEVLSDIEHLALRFVVTRDAPQDGKTKGKGLEAYGYGAGKQVLLDEMRVFFNECDGLVAAGINVVITAHASVIKHNNPSGPDFDRHVFLCSPLVGPFAHGWADEVGFLRFDDVAVKAEGKRGKNKGIFTGKRILQFDHSAAWDAKARLPFPESIQVPSGRPWQFYRDALHRAYMMTAADLRAEILVELERIGDPELDPKVAEAVAKVGDNKDRLTAFMQDLRRRPAKEKEETTQSAQVDDE